VGNERGKDYIRRGIQDRVERKSEEKRGGDGRRGWVVHIVLKTALVQSTTLTTLDNPTLCKFRILLRHNLGQPDSIGCSFGRMTVPVTDSSARFRGRSITGSDPKNKVLVVLAEPCDVFLEGTEVRETVFRDVAGRVVLLTVRVTGLGVAPAVQRKCAVRE
jgi:hypothetical protein